MKIISIKIVLPSKSKAFVVFVEEIQRLEIAYKNNHFEWRKTRIKNKSRGNLRNCDSLITTRCVFPTKTNLRTNFWIKTNVTSIPMKFEALLGLLASLYKSRVWRYIWNDTSRRIRKNKTLDLKNHSNMNINALALFWNTLSLRFPEEINICESL